jgi:hypothetical protein
MSGSSNSVEPLSLPAAERPTEAEWYLQLLETCQAVVGLPTIVSLILAVFTTDAKTISAGAAIALIVAFILRYFPKLRHMLMPTKGLPFWTALPWLLTAALVAVLIFQVIPSRAAQQSHLLSNAWLKWQGEFEQAASQCSRYVDEVDKSRDESAKAKAEKNRDQCLKTKLVPVIARRPRPQEPNPTGLASDLWAAQCLLFNDNTKSVIKAKWSVDENFLGSGFSVPQGKTDITTARSPEYLVDNVPDTSPNVWLWKIDYGSPIMEQNLLEVLKSEPQANADAKVRRDFGEMWTSRLQSNDSRQILVRFALIDPPTLYSGCLGRPSATRVFMSDLRDLELNTVHRAAQSTGFVRPEGMDKPGLKLFIWVYAPPEEDLAVKATWGNVLDNFGKWITADSVCSHSGA